MVLILLCVLLFEGIDYLVHISCLLTPILLLPGDDCILGIGFPPMLILISCSHQCVCVCDMCCWLKSTYL